MQGIAHPADRRKSRAPFALPNATQMLGGATPTVDLDSRGKNVMGTNTFDFVYGGNPSGSTPTITAAVFNPTGRDEPKKDDVDLNLSDSFEIPPGADVAAASVKTNGVSARSSDTWDKPLTESDGQTMTKVTATHSSGFDTAGDDTMRMLLKMKDGAHGDAPQPPLTPPPSAATPPGIPPGLRRRTSPRPRISRRTPGTRSPRRPRSASSTPREEEEARSR